MKKTTWSAADFHITDKIVITTSNGTKHPYTIDGIKDSEINVTTGGSISFKQMNSNDYDIITTHTDFNKKLKVYKIKEYNEL